MGRYMYDWESEPFLHYSKEKIVPEPWECAVIAVPDTPLIGPPTAPDLFHDELRTYFKPPISVGIRIHNRFSMPCPPEGWYACYLNFTDKSLGWIAFRPGHKFTDEDKTSLVFSVLRYCQCRIQEDEEGPEE